VLLLTFKQIEVSIKWESWARNSFK